MKCAGSSLTINDSISLCKFKALLFLVLFIFLSIYLFRICLWLFLCSVWCFFSLCLLCIFLFSFFILWFWFIFTFLCYRLVTWFFLITFFLWGILKIWDKNNFQHVDKINKEECQMFDRWHQIYNVMNDVTVTSIPFLFKNFRVIHNFLTIKSGLAK